MKKKKMAIICKNYIINLLPLLLVLLSSGCFTLKKIHFTIQAKEEMNCGGNSCVILIYRLKDDRTFLQTPVESFWQGTTKPFGDDMLAEEIKIQLIPNEIKTTEVTIPKETNFIGIAADFACVENEGWRKVHSFAVKRSKKLYVTVGSNKVKIDY